MVGDSTSCLALSFTKMKVTPIDIIKDMSGKVCRHSDTSIALNHSSGKMHTSKLCNPYTGDPTQAQLAQQQSFKTRAAYATAWLNANKPSTANGEKGTAAYQEAQRLKVQQQLSNVRQVVCKYMNDQGVVTLPSGATGNAGGGSTGSPTTYSVTLTASPAAGGTVTGSCSGKAAGSQVAIQAVANEGYSFSKWSDNDTNASRTITVNSNVSLQAIFVTTGGGDNNPGGGEDPIGD